MMIRMCKKVLLSSTLQFLADQLTLSGGHIIPTQYYVPSRAVRPCDGLGSYKFQGIETRLNAYGPLYVEKPPK